MVSGGDLTMDSDLIISELNSSPIIVDPTGCEEGVSVDFGISYRPVPVSTGVGTGFSFGNYFIQFFSPTVDLDCICQNFIFVIDKSGSMAGLKIQQAKEAAEYLLNSLSDSDFFNVIAFDFVVTSLRPSPVPVGELFNLLYNVISLLPINDSKGVNSGLNPFAEDLTVVYNIDIF